MLLMNRTALLGLTLIAALGIGFVMQMMSSSQSADALPEPLEVTEITLTASSVVPKAAPAPVTEVVPVSAETDAPAPVETVAEAETDELACPISLSANPLPAAMVELSLQAECLTNERVTFHHNGMMFSEATDTKGALRIVVPALSKKAVFIASFQSGDGAVATLDVGSLGSYDRIVVQWKGAAGLGLHAREFGADYFTKGHIWAETPGTAKAVASGESGLLSRHGRDDITDPLLAEVYTFPSRMTKRAGDVNLSVEAEVTEANCGRQVDAQTLEYHQTETLKVQDLTLFMPDCDTVGDFLVLKNLLEDLTIAAK